MTVISNIVEIRCTPEEALDYHSDHRSELEWNPGIESTGKLTDGPVGLGTRYLEIRPELGPPRLGRGAGSPAAPRLAPASPRRPSQPTNGLSWLTPSPGRAAC